MDNLQELEQKIRKAIPECKHIEEPIQLNHVLEYLSIENAFIEKEAILKLIKLWNLKSNLLSDQNEVLIKFVNEL